VTESISVYPEGSPSITRVCVFGCTGMLGTALISALHRSGATVIGFSRTRKDGRPGFGHWDPDAGTIEVERLRDADAVVNLAGEDIAGGRWTTARKQKLRDSRIRSTELIARTLVDLPQRPRVWVNASAVGFYGDRGDDAVYEDSAPGEGFLAKLCQDWEAATEPAAEAGMRVVRMRFGVVLARQGGALGRMLGPFKLGVGGRFGSGQQRMPWIALSDAANVMRFAMRHPDLSGPVNAVAPESVTNALFTETLARVLHRSAPLPVPAFALKAALGSELAQEALLTGANVRPRKLEVHGYRFEYPRLQDALEAMLERKSHT
jgi:uncharacterized protein (TIGR01777 family)